MAAIRGQPEVEDQSILPELWQARRRRAPGFFRLGAREI
jgi:hypothetical protein